MSTSFSVTFDYRCPFARIGHLHVLAGLRDGADWDVTFTPLSLGQLHVADGHPDVWDDPEKESGLLALQVGTLVRDRWPEQFPAVHTAVFDARHVDSLDLRDREVLARALDGNGVPSTEVFDEIAEGGVLDTVRKEHESAVSSNDVWGVPTFVQDDRAVFVRLMQTPTDDADGRLTVERLFDLLAWTDLNEFKATSIPR